MWRKQTLNGQNASSPQATKLPRRFANLQRYVVLLLLFSLLICGFLISTKLSTPGTKTAKATLHPSKSFSTQAANVANRFMIAFMHKDWLTTWSMLHPDAQRSWQGRSDFVHFEQAKFDALHLENYKASSPDIVLSWRNPDNTQLYPYAVVFTVSLNAQAPGNLLSPPSDFALNHGLFADTPLALVENNDRWQVMLAGPADLEAPILVPASPHPFKLKVPIFMYHHISNRPTKNLLDYDLTVTVTNFDQQLNYLQQHGYQTITQTELFDALYYGKVLPPHPVILSFDDGYEDVYTGALPGLLAHHYRGVFYIVSGLIGGNYMTWNQVRELYRDGMQISSHTVHHVNVGNPPAGTNTQAELTLSRQTLESELAQPIQFFCYPSGEPFHTDTLAQRRIVLLDLYQDGYVGATLDPFYLFSTVQDTQFPYQLNRIRVSGGESLGSFIGILNTALITSSEKEI